MDHTKAPCLACDAAVSPEETTCPVCGYDVDHHHRARLWLGGLGTALTLSIVLAPVGLALLWRAHHHRVAAAGTVTRREAPAVAEHLARVLRHHVGLARPIESPDEFRRVGLGSGVDALEPPRSYR